MSHVIIVGFVEGWGEHGIFWGIKEFSAKVAVYIFLLLQVYQENLQCGQWVGSNDLNGTPYLYRPQKKICNANGVSARRAQFE